ncbi:MAG: MFS transporter [Chloroflexales bacterium]|nr:MFS transporter [Chloroflexales bacterium]
MSIMSWVRQQAHRLDSVAPAATLAAPLTPAEIRRGLRLSTIEGALATVHISITGTVGGSVFLTGFALLLGANSFQIGLLGALPFIGQLFQFVGAYLGERQGQRRPLALYTSLAGRLIWVFLLALPFITMLQAHHAVIFLCALACSYALNGIAGNAWMSWMSDLVPPHQRGRYFGTRNMVVGVATMASTFAAGHLLDFFHNRGQDRLGYALIFAIAVVFALAAALVLHRQPEPPLQRKARVQWGAVLGGPLREPRFRRFVMAATGWTLVTGIASPFYNAYGLTELGVSFATLALAAIVTSAVSLVSYPFIGRLQDRFGNKLVLVICTFGVAPLPWGWILSTPSNLVPLWLTAIFSGIFWPGIIQGLVNVLMDRAPTENRAAFMAVYAAITGLGTLVAGLLGGILASILLGMQLSLGPLTLSSLSLLFVLTSIGRVAMAGVFWRYV